MPPQLNRWTNGTALASVILASDTGLYELGVAHPWYNDGHVIIVFASHDEPEVTSEFRRWVEILGTGQLPEYIEVPTTSFLSALIELVSGPQRHYKTPTMGVG